MPRISLHLQFQITSLISDGITPSPIHHVIPAPEYDGSIVPQTNNKGKATGKGPSIKYVRTEGGGDPKAYVVREVAGIYSYDSAQNANKGGRGSKKPENLRTYLMDGP